MFELIEPDRVEGLIGHRFADRTLLARALTHSSLRGPEMPCNERMEFLGDSILGMVVASHLFATMPDHQEGDLTRIKSAVVSRSTIGAVCREMDLGPHIGLGKGISSRKRLPLSIFANVYEALIAAVFLDAGMEAASGFILSTLAGRISDISNRKYRWNFKSRLQDLAQKEFAGPPRYGVLAEEGPDHNKSFQIEAVVNGIHYPAAWGSSKKEAEQKAARMALEALLGGILDEEGPALDESVVAREA